MKRNLTIALLSLLLTMICIVGAVTVFAAPDGPLLTLEAEQGSLDGNACVWGTKVGNMGKCGGDIEGTVTFPYLDIPEDGKYALMVYYCSGSDDRYFNITTDKDIYKLDCPNTGSFDSVGTIVIEVELEAGGVLIFGSDWYGPDLDKIEIYPVDGLAFEKKEYTNPEEYTWQSIIRLDTNNGVYSLLSGCQPVLANAHAEVLIDGKMIASDEFGGHSYTEDNENKILTFKHTSHPVFDGEMIQTFKYQSGYVITEVSVILEGDIISTNYISPVSTYNDSVRVKDCAFIQFPFDNDKWIEPKFTSVNDMGRITSGYEVGVFYNQSNSNGLIVGSLSHDTWKTGINVYSDDGAIMGIDVFGGAADSNTRDTVAHGYVSGEKVTSPKMFLGFYESWQTGLLRYGKANTSVTPAKESDSKVPFGYNSWGSLQSSVKYSDMIKVSEYIKENLQEIWDEDEGSVYVNIDSFWDYIVRNDPSCNMTLDEALAAFVKCCKDNGQKAGIYYTPFASWLANEDELKNTVMEGSDYTYYDAALKLEDGSIYGQLAGGYALDPTHPGTIARINDRLNYFVDLGFEYIKLDFMTHGALEGKHYDKSVTTGMQAYNKGMAQIDGICKGKMFVNLSIAPVFPYQYADGRRISCDAFASVDNTKHVLSYLSACFWHKEIYNYPDPDHLVVLGSSEGVGRCRVTSGVISGTSFLIGDNISNIQKGSGDYNKLMKLFGNKDIVSVAKLGKAFIPYEMKGGDRCSDAYWCIVDDTLYFAVFNFGGGEKEYDLSKIADGMTKGLTAKELWRGSSVKLNGTVISCDIPSEDAALYCIDLTSAGDDTADTSIPTQIPQTTTPEGSSTPADTQVEDDGKQNNTVVILVVIVAVCLVAAGGAVGFIMIKKKNNK